jgi:hypothetical protein
LGLTASPAGAETKEKTRELIRELTSTLGNAKICIVQDQRNRDELRNVVAQASQEVEEIPLTPDQKRFIEETNKKMTEIEEEFRKKKDSPPKKKGSNNYDDWINNMLDSNPTPEERKKLTTLKKLNELLGVCYDCGIATALEEQTDNPVILALKKQFGEELEKVILYFS